MRIRSNIRVLIFLAAGWIAAPALAQAPKEQFWEYKEWRSYTEAGKAGKTCKALTGGNGDPKFVVSVQPGGINGAVYFEEQGVRGSPSVLRRGDDILFKIDGKISKVYDYDIAVRAGIGPEGIAEASAGMPSGYTPDLTRVMRSSSTLSVLRENPRTKKQDVLHKFSLDGFAANFLKLAEWCKFNPDKMAQS